MPGVDGFLVGPYDLSASLGVPGELDHRKVKKYLSILESKITDDGVVGGEHVVHSDIEKLQSKIDKGYKFIAYGDDMLFLAEKLNVTTEQLTKFK